MKYAIVAPVGAGVTADAGWMARFAGHAEACDVASACAQRLRLTS